MIPIHDLWDSRPNGPRAPIVVWCNHGIGDQRGDFVQRYRWEAAAAGDPTDGEWLVTDKTGEGETWPGESDAWPLASGQIASELGAHWTARCKECGRLVSMRAEQAHFALTAISNVGLVDVSLPVLQRFYDEAPRWRVPGEHPRLPD